LAQLQCNDRDNPCDQWWPLLKEAGKSSVTEQPKVDPPRLLLDQKRKEVRWQGRLLPLFPQELAILCLLAQHPGQFLSPEQIYRQTTEHPLDGAVYLSNIRAQVSRLRRKLPHPDYILSRRNAGYAFNAQLPSRLVEE
jgi:DNA-binding response OmpR family regulator